MGQEWYVETSFGRSGPFTPADLRKLAQAGTITPESLVSLDGENWSPAARVKGLVFPDAPPNQPPPAGECALAETERDKPGGRPYPTYPSPNVIPLDKVLADLRDDPPRLSSAEGLPARFGISFGLAASVATAVALLVKMALWIELVELKTIATSLAALVGLPAVAFVAVFALIFWYCGRDVEPPQISGDMSDDEIADVLKRY